MKKLTVLLLGMALSAFGAGVAGTWKATAEGPNGTLERTFTFQVDGGKLTGETTSSMLGKSPLENGKVDGDNVTFTISVKFDGNDSKVHYKGQVTGDQIKLTSEIPDAGLSIQWSGKRVTQ